MQRKTIALLILSSLFNAALCFFSFVVGVFATSPDTSDVTMRVGFYAINLIALLALVGVFAPWIVTQKKHKKSAIAFAALPLLVSCITVLLFLVLDSWLNRTFS